jgi:iron complex transport system permease protein
MSSSENILNASLSYKKGQKKKYLFLSISIASALFMLFYGLTVGVKELSLSDIWSAILNDESQSQHQIVLNLRFPRLLAALLSGGTLGVAGAIMQIILRNPLGSPFTLGISNASAFGAALAYIVLGNTFFKYSDTTIFGVHHIIVTTSSFLWATVGALFIIFIARKKGATPENMILAGIIINTFFMALTSVLQFIADDIQLGSIVFWTFGDLSKTSWSILLIQSILIIPVLFYLIKNSLKYNALDSGDQIANSLGVDVHKFRLYSLILTSLLTACIVSFYGIIAFIGLIIPHVVRILIGNEARILILTSMALGALFLICCDLISRSLFSPVVIPVGIVTSIIGAPLFVLLLLKGSKRWSR